MSAMVWDPESTTDRELPPWEIAKVHASHTVLKDISEHLDTPATDLIGKRVDEYIAERVSLKGGGHPSLRTVRDVVQRCQDPSW